MRVLVTGGTGFVGSHLLELLKRTGSEVVLFSSTTPASPHVGADYRCVNVRDSAAVRSVVEESQPEQIYHLAGMSTVDEARRQPAEAYRTNVIGAHNVFDAAMNAPSPPRILNVSTAQVYAPSSKKLTEDSPLGPDNPYAVSKAMAEMLTYQYRGRKTGGVITARSFNHTGPGQSPAYVLPAMAKQFAEIEAGLRPAKLSLGNVEVKRDFTDVRDVVRAYQLLLEHGKAGEIYNVCSGTAVALIDMVELFREISEVRVSLEREPSRVRAGDTAEVCGDPSKLYADTGWQPEIPLQQTIRDLLDYWRSRCRGESALVAP